MAQTIAGIILAGGLSRRMGGGDKTLVTIAGRPLLGRIVERLSVQADPMALNANGDPQRFTGFNLPVVPDQVERFAGPLAGVLAGMEWAAKIGAHRLVTVAGDTPFFPEDLVVRLADAAGSRTDRIAVAASGERRHPTFALWPVELAGNLRRALDAGQRRVITFIERHDHVAVEFAFGQAGEAAYDPFLNVNTPQDLADAERLAQTMRP